MEGTYNKVLAAGKNIPAPNYSFFMESLEDMVGGAARTHTITTHAQHTTYMMHHIRVYTKSAHDSQVRDKIADCSECSYESLPLSQVGTPQHHNTTK